MLIHIYRIEYDGTREFRRGAYPRGDLVDDMAVVHLESLLKLASGKSPLLTSLFLPLAINLYVFMQYTIRRTDEGDSFFFHFFTFLFTEEIVATAG